MEKMDYWRLCDELTVVQAALLIVGVDPGEQPYVMDWEEHKRPENFSAVLSALTNGILGDSIPATIRYSSGSTQYSYFDDLVEYPTESPDWSKTTVHADDIKQWLKSRGITKGFFFPDKDDTQDFLDTSNQYNSPKLAAAINAWQAVSADPELIKGTTVKKALLKWLRTNADKLGLIKDDGNPNEQGIKEIAKIANWDTKGGAPKTPG